MKNHFAWRGLITAISLDLGIGSDIYAARNLLKQPIDHAHMKMHMLIQAGAKAVGEDATLQIVGKGLSHIGLGGTVVSPPIELASAAFTITLSPPTIPLEPL